jgi:hypothetical protein
VGRRSTVIPRSQYFGKELPTAEGRNRMGRATEVQKTAFMIYYLGESGRSGPVVDHAARRCGSTTNGSLIAGLSSLN